MLSLIIPVYKNEKNLPDLLKALQGINQKLSFNVEFVFVIDGSPDNSFIILQKELEIMSRDNFRSQLILLSKNFGSFSAIRAGLEKANGKYFAVMAADLQEPPELIIKMYERLKSNNTNDINAVDVVIGTRKSRKDPFMQKIQAQIFWGFYKKFIVPQMPAGGIDIFACNIDFRDALLNLDERRSSLIAQIFWLGFRLDKIEYERQERTHGKSAWTFSKKISYLADSIFAFTDLPVRLLMLGGFIGTFIALLLSLSVFIAKITGSISIPGYAITLITILFFSALNLLGLGIVGTYAWRSYENTKQRPHSIILKTKYFNPRDFNKNE